MMQCHMSIMHLAETSSPCVPVPISGNPQTESRLPCTFARHPRPQHNCTGIGTNCQGFCLQPSLRTVWHPSSWCQCVLTMPSIPVEHKHTESKYALNRLCFGWAFQVCYPWCYRWLSCFGTVTVTSIACQTQAQAHMQTATS